MSPDGSAARNPDSRLVPDDGGPLVESYAALAQGATDASPERGIKRALVTDPGIGQIGDLGVAPLGGEIGYLHAFAQATHRRPLA